MRQTRINSRVVQSPSYETSVKLSLTQRSCQWDVGMMVQAVRVKIGQVCALLEEITIFCPDDK